MANRAATACSTHLCVQGTGGLIQEQDLGVLQDGTRNGNALLLPATELQATLAHLHQHHNDKPIKTDSLYF